MEPLVHLENTRFNALPERLPTDEMVTGSLYGCDADESGKLLIFCDDDEEVIDILHDIAKHEATKELERLLSEMEMLTINDDSSGFRPQGG